MRRRLTAWEYVKAVAGIGAFIIALTFLNRNTPFNKKPTPVKKL